MSKQTPWRKELMFSSKVQDWATPQDFFDKVNTELGPFTLDACASEQNAKCNKFFTAKDDGLTQDWHGNNVFVNPPYGRGIDKWIKKAYEESQKSRTRVVMLIPARTDTKYWHDYVMKADVIYFVKGRLTLGQKRLKLKSLRLQLIKVLHIWRSPIRQEKWFCLLLRAITSREHMFQI